MEDADEETNITIKLHPLVVLNISQHFTRIRKWLHFSRGMMFGPEKYLKEHLEADAILAQSFTWCFESGPNLEFDT